MTFPSKRSGVNKGFPFDAGLFIDQARAGSVGPYSTSYGSGIMWNRDVINPVTCLPNHASVKDKKMGGFPLWVPASTDFAGPYVLTWQGNMNFQIQSGTWTVNAGLSSNYEEYAANAYRGTNSRIILTYSGAGGFVNTSSDNTDLNSVGAFPTEIHFYRLEEETDLLAGKLFRRARLQQIVDYNPGYMRHMNWAQTNNSIDCRFRTRNKITQQGWSGYNFLLGDTYGEITGTNTYAIADSAASPVAMEHGEVVQGRVTNTMVRGGAITITGITKAASGVATYSGSTNPSNGDQMIWRIFSGMTELHQRVVTISSVNTGAKTFEFGVNTSGYTTFTSGQINQYITLNRGGLGAYPVMFEDGTVPASYYGNAYISAGDYKYFLFNRTLVGRRDASGVDVPGVWIFSNYGESSKQLAVPIELIAKFHKELDDMQVAQSIIRIEALGPTDCYINVPHFGLCSMDPDYDADDHYGIGMVDLILNGSGEYKLPARCDLLVADSNETWNSGGVAFSQQAARARLGYLRWGGAVGETDNTTFHTLHACVLAKDIRAAFPAEHTSGRIRHIMEGWGDAGVTAFNLVRIEGSAVLDADATYIALGGGDPIDYFDAFAFASYFYSEDNLATYAAQYAAASNDVEREAACAGYMVGVWGTNNDQTISRYLNVILPDLCDLLASKGKVVINYEGGWDLSITGYTTEINTFVIAVKRSRALANAWQKILAGWRAQAGEANVATTAYYPGDYFMWQERWGHANPDPGFGYSGGIEGAELDQSWIRIGKNNRGIRVLEGSA